MTTGDERKGEETKESKGSDGSRRMIGWRFNPKEVKTRPDVAKAHTHLQTHAHTDFLATIHPQRHTDFRRPPDAQMISRSLLKRVCITVADCGAVFTALLPISSSIHSASNTTQVLVHRETLDSGQIATSGQGHAGQNRLQLCNA